MRVVKSDFIPGRSRPGKTTTVTSDWATRVTGGHATWMQRKGGKQWRKRKERNEERKKAKKIKLRVATLNVGTMTECSKTSQNSGQCDNHLDKVEESTKISEENKMVETKGLESE